MTVEYKPRGVCSSKITVSAENGVITKAEIEDGCSGNIQGLCRLVVGMEVKDAISRLQGIHCGRKDTSCPDQLSIALGQLDE